MVCAPAGATVRYATCEGSGRWSASTGCATSARRETIVNSSTSTRCQRCLSATSSSDSASAPTRTASIFTSMPRLSKSGTAPGTTEVSANMVNTLPLSLFLLFACCSLRSESPRSKLQEQTHEKGVVPELSLWVLSRWTKVQIQSVSHWRIGMLCRAYRCCGCAPLVLHANHL